MHIHHLCSRHVVTHTFLSPISACTVGGEGGQLKGSYSAQHFHGGQGGGGGGRELGLSSCDPLSPLNMLSLEV